MESSGTSHDERVFARLVVVVMIGAYVTGCIGVSWRAIWTSEVNGAVEVTIACTSCLIEAMAGHSGTDGVVMLAGAQPRQTTELMI
ncbi:hypothetical protein ACVIIV_004246 [Bradyrhizobium sp. USDA 4354]